MVVLPVVMVVPVPVRALAVPAHARVADARKFFQAAL
jgi:hypothetical protein